MICTNWRTIVAGCASVTVAAEATAGDAKSRPKAAATRPTTGNDLIRVRMDPPCGDRYSVGITGTGAPGVTSAPPVGTRLAFRWHIAARRVRCAEKWANHSTDP